MEDLLKEKPQADSDLAAEIEKPLAQHRARLRCNPGTPIGTWVQTTSVIHGNNTETNIGAGRDVNWAAAPTRIGPGDKGAL